MTSVLLPELSAHWDEPDSFSMAGYRRNGGGWHGDHRPYHRAHGHRHGRYRY